MFLIAWICGLLPCITGYVGSTYGDASLDTPPTDAEPDGWVVVYYDQESWDTALDGFDALLETEMAADEALAAADRGWIDGNEIGEESYDIYFNGYDRDKMWATLEPILATAPLKWTRVELRNGLEDPAPVELTQ